MRRLIPILLFLTILATGQVMAQNVTDYYKWIGPTVNGTPSPMIIENAGYNMTWAALFGVDENGTADPRNASIDNFNAEGIIGSLSWPYNAVPGILIVIIGFVLAIIMFVKLDGDMLIPGGILIMSGLLSGAGNLAMAVPWEMILFSTLAVVLGVGAMVIQLLLGRAE
jgi:hypothetical protein